MISTNVIIAIPFIGAILALIIHFFKKKFSNNEKKESYFQFLITSSIALFVIIPVILCRINSDQKNSLENERYEKEFRVFINENWGGEYQLVTLSSKQELHGDYSGSYFLFSGSSSGSVTGKEYIQFQRVYPLSSQTVSTTLPRHMVRTVEDNTVDTPYITYAFKSEGVSSYSIKRAINKNGLTSQELKDSPGIVENELGLRYITVFAKKEDLPKVVDLQKLN